MNIVLASASPRRQELLARIGLPFTIQIPDIDENNVSGLQANELVETLSQIKATEVAKNCTPDDLVIAADTVVVLDGHILGKPSSKEEALSMLSSLSGRTHEVYTGVTIRQGDRFQTTHEISSVRFRLLSAEEIHHYISTGEPMDKAGAYGIQGYGALLISGIQGDYFNVMGLPVCRLGQMLCSFGIDVLTLASKREGGEIE
jgi:septum formation protein